jgi:uncharacterized membrane protein
MGEMSERFITFLTAMLPVLELRGAIPLGILKFGLSLKEVYILSVIGNLIPVIPILLFLKFGSGFLRKYKWGDKFFTWLFAHTRRRSQLVEKYESLGLMLFVAIPLPITGAWTGSVAAFLFGIRFRYAFLAIILGVLLAGIIVVIATKLGFTLFTGIR